MNYLRQILLLLVLVPLPGFAQTTFDSSTHVPSGALLPATCTVNQVYAMTTSNPIAGLFACTANNTWKFVPGVPTGVGFPANCMAGSAMVRTDQSGPNFYVCSTANKFLPPAASVAFLLPLASVGGSLLSDNNLSDLNNRQQAVINLGLGSAAYQDASAFDPANTAAAITLSGLGGVTLSQAAAAAPVQRVAGRTGVVTLSHSDITDWASATSSLGAGTFPASGIAVSTGSAWGSSLAAPSSALVGISDAQSLTNKSIAAAEINSGNLSLSVFPQLANNTILGNVSGSTGVPTALTAVNLASILSTTTYNANTSTSLVGGSTGTIPYQSGAGASAFLSGNTAATDQVLVSHGTGVAAQAPSLSNAPALSAVNMTNFPTLNQNTTGSAGSATNFTGSLVGDVVGTQGATSVVKVNSGSIPLSAPCVATNAIGQFTSTACGGGGSMVYPGAGIAVSTGSAWGTSLTTPSSALVGISDTQAITNKSIGASEINSGNLSLSVFPQVSNNTILGNISGSTGVPAALTTANLAGLLVTSLAVNGGAAQTGAISLSVLQPDTYTAGTGGVTLNTVVASGSSSNQVITPSAGSCGFGIAQATVASGGSVSVKSSGLVSVLTDMAVPLGHLVTCSSTTGGYATDTGQTSTTKVLNTTPVIGVVVQASTGAGTLAGVRWHGPGIFGTAVPHSFGTTFTAGGAALSPGAVTYLTVPFACTINGYVANVDTGTVTFDVWKVAAGTANPTSTNSIVAGLYPAISSGTARQSSTLTGWSTTVAQNDIVAIQLRTVSSSTQATLGITCQ